MHFNKNYIYDGKDLIISQLFIYDDLTDISKSRMSIVEGNIKGYFSLDKKLIKVAITRWTPPYLIET